MIAHIIFDLPLEGPFDYAVPPQLQAGLPGRQAGIAVGKRVSVAFSHRSAVGWVAGLADTSAIKDLKPIRAVLDASPVVDGPLWALAGRMSSMYGCSLGQAVGLMVPKLLRDGRRMDQEWPSVKQGLSFPNVSQAFGGDNSWMDSVRQTFAAGRSVLILVPDAFAMGRLRPPLQKAFGDVPILFHQPRAPKEELDQWTTMRSGGVRIVVGTRSSVFSPLADLGLIAVVDEGDPSFREEQTPFYETRDVALMRARLQGAEVLLVSSTPSVEAWHALAGKAPAPVVPAAKIQVVDLTTYKYVEKGIVSVVLRGRLEEALKAKAQSVLVLNRRGLYAVTRCLECAYTLACPRCSCAMTFSRRGKHFACAHCSSTLPADTVCPKCRKPSWKSFGMGVEKLQGELTGMFPQAKVVTFERGDTDLPSGDILIATQAVLRFKDRLKPQVAALVDFDNELDRLDMRSSYRAWALAVRLRAMATGTLVVQTRNSSHHVLRALAADDPKLFYDEELRLRKELGFSPFAHWAAVTVRGAQEKTALNFAQDVYNILSAAQGIQVSGPQPGVPAKVRGRYRFVVLVQGPKAEDMMAVIKEGLSKLKRISRLIVTIELDL